MKHHKKKGRDRIEAFRAALHHSFQKSVAAHQVSGLKKPEVKPPGSVDPGALKIGIVGGGMAGMYAQLLLKELGIKSEIFEASDGRVGDGFTRIISVISRISMLNSGRCASRKMNYRIVCLIFGII